MPLRLSLKALKKEASLFAASESKHDDLALYGVTDGKAIGTYLEHKFQQYLIKKYQFTFGSSAKGIDFPQLNVDLKTTSIRQPQSSCPFQSAQQKIYGLGYHLLIFVYDKKDNRSKKTGRLTILHSVFVDQGRTSDFQTTTGLLKILENKGNEDDLCAFFQERMLPVDEIQAHALAREVLRKPPAIGYLTISNALQWRLQYSRVMQQAGSVAGIDRL
jgi:hypothetical protein